MRTGFRILVLDKSKNKVDESLIKDKNLAKAIKYIHKFQYLEASKWLFLAGDSKEKYILLSLINIAIEQKDEAMSYINVLDTLPYSFKDSFDIYIQKPSEALEEAENFIKDYFLTS